MGPGASGSEGSVLRSTRTIQPFGNCANRGATAINRNTANAAWRFIYIASGLEDHSDHTLTATMLSNQLELFPPPESCPRGSSATPRTAINNQAPAGAAQT